MPQHGTIHAESGTLSTGSPQRQHQEADVTCAIQQDLYSADMNKQNGL